MAMRWLWALLAGVATVIMFYGVWGFLRAPSGASPSADERTMVRTVNRGMPVTVFGEGLYDDERRTIGYLLQAEIRSGWSPSSAEAVAACDRIFALTAPELMDIWRDYP